MATRNGSARVVQVGPPELMALALMQVAATAAGTAARAGGYRPSDAQWRGVGRALSQGILAMVALVDDWRATTDEQLEGAAEDLAVRVLHEVLGPAPMAH